MCEIEFFGHSSPVTRDALINGIKGKQALFCQSTDVVDKEVLDAAGPQLKVIATMSVGYDHINLQECKRRNIHVGHSPGVSTSAVAEMTVTLLLAVARKIIDAASAIKRGEWIQSWNPAFYRGQGLAGSTVGIVGMGRIGQAVLKRVLPFDVARVLYSDVYHPIQPAEEMGARYSSFEELLQSSDFVIATCNLTEQNRELFNAKAFGLMKRTAVFINTSRGGVVHQDDMFEALKNGTISAAGIDVMYPEPLPRDHKLTTLPNLVLLPHIASAEVSAHNELSRIAAENILAALDGKALPGAVPMP